MKRFRYLKTLICCCVVFTGRAQNSHLFDTMLKKYPDKSMVEVLNSKKIELSVKEGKIKIIETYFEESIFLKDNASQYNKYPVYSNSFVKVNNIKAQTLIPHDKGYKTIENTNIEIMSDNSSSSFYDDQKKHLIHFDNTEKGAIRRISYEMNYEDPHFFGQEIVCAYAPIEKYELEIKCSKDIDLEIKFFNDDGLNAKMRVTEDKKFKVYTLKLNSIREYDHFVASPGHKWYMPHLIFHIRSYLDKGEKKDLLSNVNSLFNWYAGLLKNLPPITDESLKKITDSLTMTKETEKDKVKNVFYWVQKNIKYVAFEEGLGGFVPRDASLIYQKKYGDCKDMAFLIYSMLNYAKIPCYLTWIGSRNLPYSFTQVPTPLTDDHMIACYRDRSGSTIFLDATDKEVKFGYPSSFIQNKQGLIATTSQFIDTMYVPIVPAYKNLTIDSSTINISKEEITGECKNYFYGYNRIDFLNSVSYLSKTKKDDYYKDEYEKGNNKFFINNLIENYTLNDSCAAMKFNFTIRDYFKRSGPELFINMNIERNLDLFVLEDTFTTPYAFDQKSTHTFVKLLNIPPGYSVTYVPKDYVKETKDYSFSISYEIKGTQLVSRVTLFINTLMIARSEIPAWNSFVKEYNKQSKELVILTEKK